MVAPIGWRAITWTILTYYQIKPYEQNSATVQSKSKKKNYETAFQYFVCKIVASFFGLNSFWCDTCVYHWAEMGTSCGDKSRQLPYATQKHQGLYWLSGRSHFIKMYKSRNAGLHVWIVKSLSRVGSSVMETSHFSVIKQMEYRFHNFDESRDMMVRYPPFC